MHKKDIAGLKVDSITKQKLLVHLQERMRAGEKTFVATPYSEFLYRSLRDQEIRNILNTADISVPDGIGIFWAAKFLSIPFIFSNYWLKILEAFCQALYTLLSILLYPKYTYSVLPGAEKIPGSDLVWDLSKMAAKNGWSIFLLGGYGDTPKLVADQLISRSSDQLKIAGYSSRNANDPLVYDEIKRANPDMIFVAYGPIKQERWIASNMHNLPAKLYIGLGGTFDYIAGKRPSPPKFIRKAGLEWFYRLITQPQRFKRIFNATFGLTLSLIRYKIFQSQPYRKNVVSVVLSKDNKVFIARYNPEKEAIKKLGRGREDFVSYWQFPQGGLEEGEELEEGARRELWEETAMRNLDLIKISGKSHAYYWQNTAQRPLLVSKRYRYCGQEQNIVYFKFTGTEKEINLDQDEFLEYKWINIQDLEKELHTNKQPLVKIALEDLKSR